MARKYGSQSERLQGRDAQGNLPAPELTDAEIAERLAEKIALQAQMARERGRARAGELELEPVGRDDDQPIGPLGEHHAAVELVVAVGPAAGDPQREVDLGRRLFLDP